MGSMSLPNTRHASKQQLIADWLPEAIEHIKSGKKTVRDPTHLITIEEGKILHV